MRKLLMLGAASAVIVIAGALVGEEIMSRHLALLGMPKALPTINLR